MYIKNWLILRTKLTSHEIVRVVPSVSVGSHLVLCHQIGVAPVMEGHRENFKKVLIQITCSKIFSPLFGLLFPSFFLGLSFLFLLLEYLKSFGRSL